MQLGPELYSVGHGILVSERGWSFGGDVCDAFDDHIRASVPGYDELHETVVSSAEPFLARGGRACDLGCSTGTLTTRLARHFPRASVLGVDIEPRMLNIAKREAENHPEYLCRDLTRLLPPGSELRRTASEQGFGLVAGLDSVPERLRPWALAPQSFICACYALMFTPPAERLRTLCAIRKSLLPQAGFVLAEKVQRRDALEERRCQAELFEFKLAQGLTEAEIRAKTLSLRHALLPLFDDENLTLLRLAGFKRIQRIFSRACFDAWLATT